MTLAEYESINWKYLRKTRKLWFVLPVFMLSIFSLNTCNVLISSNPEDKSNVTGSLSSLIVLLLFLGFLYYSFIRGFKKNYLNTPALAEGLTYTLSDEAIETQGLSTNSKQPWPASFKQAVKIGKWILLASSGTTAYFLDTEKLIQPFSVTDITKIFGCLTILMFSLKWP